MLTTSRSEVDDSIMCAYVKFEVPKETWETAEGTGRNFEENSENYEQVTDLLEEKVREYERFWIDQTEPHDHALKFVFPFLQSGQASSH